MTARMFGLPPVIDLILTGLQRLLVINYGLPANADGFYERIPAGAGSEVALTIVSLMVAKHHDQSLGFTLHDQESAFVDHVDRHLGQRRHTRLASSQLETIQL